MTDFERMKDTFEKLNLEFKVGRTEEADCAIEVYDNYGGKSSFLFCNDGSFMKFGYYEDAACYDSNVEGDDFKSEMDNE